MNVDAAVIGMVGIAARLHASDITAPIALKTIGSAHAERKNHDSRPERDPRDRHDLDVMGPSATQTLGDHGADEIRWSQRRVR